MESAAGIMISSCESGPWQQRAGLDVETFFILLEKGPWDRGWERGLRPDVAQIRCPVLAIWGAEDSFLPPGQSAARLRKYLAEARLPDCEIRVFPGASLFLTVGSALDRCPRLPFEHGNDGL
jgi:pimeloyl-ACP methyl ester carboxylesterase